MSQSEGSTTKIGDHEYTMYMLPPMQSHGLLMDVLKMVGPTIGPLMDRLFSSDKSGQDVMEQEVGSEFFTRAAHALFTGLDKGIVKDVISAFRKCTLVDGKSLDSLFDAHFLGKLDEMYRWLFWGLQVQWGKSFSALLDAMPERGAAMIPGGSRSRKGSTG